MDRLAHIRQSIEFARGYTQRFLDATPVDDWLRIPAAGVSHVAWQVGHLAMAQYRLALERVRDHRPEDAQLVSDEFLRVFGRDSVPTTEMPIDLAEIQATFLRVHEQVLAELSQWPEPVLDEAVLKPHAIARTKFDALQWCANHELVHAGQIGLLRRQLGHPPLW